MQQTKHFSTNLLSWFAAKPRPLPWKSDPSPYKIWVSEIILQQTRVKQGIPYYLKFIEAFPNIQALAEAPLDDVLAVWKGLGYYSRARNIHTAAQQIMSDFDGVFPNTYEDILSLKGIGPYTAAAVASFAYDLAYPVIDGNVFRVITRIFGIEKAIEKSSTRKDVLAICQKAMGHSDEPAIFNQAIMNFGAMACLPQSPDCGHCIMQNFCFAYKTNKVDQLPLKKKAKPRVKRYLHYLIIHDTEHIYASQRIDKDIWQGLYQFPLIEKNDEKIISKNSLKDYLFKHFGINTKTILHTSDIQRQVLSHQEIYARFYTIELDHIFEKKNDRSLCMSIEEFTKKAKPKIVDDFFTNWIKLKKLNG